MSRRAGLLILLLAAVSAYGWFDVRQRARIDREPRQHRTDFTVYQYAARALVDGADPYDAPNPRGYLYVYPPFLAVMLMPLADWDPADAGLLWFALSVLAFVVALRAVAHLPVREGTARLGWIPTLVAGLVLCAGFAHQSFQRGQVTHILLALQVLALTALFWRRTMVAGLLLAIASALRLTPLLPAAVVGLGMLCSVKRLGAGPLVRYVSGLLLGLALAFVVVPLLALGEGRARDVTGRWLDVMQSVYAAAPGEYADLQSNYAINEYRFKNQAPRRVLATWAGLLRGVSFERERPDLPPSSWASVDRTSRVIGWFVILFAALGGAVWMRGEPDARYAVFFAVAVLAPVFVTRYTWPTHFLMALPALALSLGGGARRPALVFFAGTALFYAAHAPELQPIGEAGCLLIACLVFVLLFVRQERRRRL